MGDGEKGPLEIEVTLRRVQARTPTGGTGPDEVLFITRERQSNGTLKHDDDLSNADQVLDALPELARVQVRLLHVFIQHTSASITINENADPDVPTDLESSFDHLVPERFPYRHTFEGPDDMPAQVKTAMLGSSVWAPIADRA